MTEEKVRSVMDRFYKQIPSEKHSELTNLLIEAPDEAYAQIMSLPIKRKGVTLLFSLFLGGVGADRFYLNSSSLGVANGDKVLGGFKLGATVLWLIFEFLYVSSSNSGNASNFLFAVALLISLIRGVWGIADWFLTYKKAKQINFDDCAEILKSFTNVKNNNKAA
jgi:TM2 domain-containing membrane protein YozV